MCRLLPGMSGGAHLKCALFTADGKLIRVSQYATPLWSDFESLTRLLNDFQNRFPGADHAVTMTAELADIYASRKEGVQSLADLFVDIFAEDTVHFYAGSDGFVSYADIEATYEQVASMNWFATASFVSHALEAGLLIDIGSSTSDVIPFGHQKVLASGLTDHQRLINNELLYLGVIRTPLMALCNSVEWKEQACPVMNEYFATTADVYRVLEELNETDDMYDAADGKDKTLTASARRLARMIALDYPDEVSLQDCQRLALQFDRKLKTALCAAIETHRNKLQDLNIKTIIGAGCGRFLLKDIAQQIGMDYQDYHQSVQCHSVLQDSASSYATTVSLGMLYYQSVCND